MVKERRFRGMHDTWPIHLLLALDRTVRHGRERQVCSSSCAQVNGKLADYTLHSHTQGPEILCSPSLWRPPWTQEKRQTRQDVDSSSMAYVFGCWQSTDCAPAPPADSTEKRQEPRTNAAYARPWSLRRSSLDSGACVLRWSS